MANNSSSVLAPTNTPDICFITFDLGNTNRPDSVHPTWTVLVAVNSFAATPTVIVNALIIWAVLGDENLRSSPFNILLTILAASDFLVGLLSEPLYCVFLGCLLNNCPLPECKLTASSLSLIVCGGSTMVSFAIASVERYLAIEHPNFYRKHITVKNVMKVTLAIWIILVLCVLISSSVLNKSHPDLTFKVPGAVVTIILGVVTLYCSAKVQLTAYRHSRNIAQQQASVLQPDEQQQQEQRIQEYKRVFTMTMLVTLSFLGYIPIIAVTVIQALKGKDVTSDFKYISLPICITFIHLQSLINPIVMALRLSYIRQSIKNKLGNLVGVGQDTD